MPEPSVPRIIFYAQELRPGVTQFGSLHAPEGTALPDGAVEIAEDQYHLVAANPAAGWALVDGVVTNPGQAPLPPPGLAISPRQLLIGLQREALITGEEALAAAETGAVPVVVETVFATLPEQEQLEARITWAKMSVVERGHPLVAAVMANAGKSAEEADDFFVASRTI